MQFSIVRLLLIGSLLFPLISSAEAQSGGAEQGHYFNQPPPKDHSGVGITLSAGSGIFVATSEDYYGDIKADLYPEVGLMIDASALRIGLRAGLIYRKYEFDYVYYNPYWDEYVWGEYEFTAAFVPLQLDLLVALPASDILFPYFGVSPGVFLPVGDNDETLPAVSVKLGLELRPNPVVIYGDARYTYAKDDEYNAGGVMVVMGMGIRIGN